MMVNCPDGFRTEVNAMRSTLLQRAWKLAAAVLALSAFGLAAASIEAGETLPSAGTCRPTRGVPAAQDVKRGKCLFNSRTAFGQQNPDNMFATCNGCHPGGGTDRGTHPILLTNSQSQQIAVFRQAPDLRNVSFNLPLGWDGRHGGSLSDLASIRAAIQSAALGAILSPVELAGTGATQDQLDALTAYLLSISPMQPVSEPPLNPPTFEQGTLDRIAIGKQVFFGKGQCSICHPPPFFTDNQVRTNVLNPAAVFDFGFPPFGGPADPGAAFMTGNPSQTGHFKTPSLHRFYPDAEPFMHSGIFGRESRLFEFYQISLGVVLTGEEKTGLHYWLQNCPQGPHRHPASLAPTC